MGTDRNPETPKEGTMTTPATLALRHGHGLNTTTGYRVVITRRNRKTLARPELVVTFDRPESYALALEVASNARNTGVWAVIDTRYECGCWSPERPQLIEGPEPGDIELVTGYMAFHSEAVGEGSPIVVTFYPSEGNPSPAPLFGLVDWVSPDGDRAAINDVELGRVEFPTAAAKKVAVITGRGRL